MEIWHCRVDMIGKRAGKSVVGAAAYRAGVSLQSEYLGLQFDYSRKVGVACSAILLSANASSWMADRKLLWNAVEKIEKRKDATLVREIKVALTCELSLEQNKALL